MKKVLQLLCACGVVTLISACQERENIGGGLRGIGSGASAKASVYGIRAGHDLGFVIISDIASGEATSSAGSSWTGQIDPKSGGPSVNYEGDPTGITINGTRYEFINGRVFLVTTKGGSVTSRQIDVPFTAGDYEKDLDSLATHKEVEAFLDP